MRTPLALSRKCLAHCNWPRAHHSTAFALVLVRYFQLEPRAHDAAVMVLGDTAVEFSRLPMGSLPPGQPVVHRQTTCPSACTALLESEITVFADYLHMHHTGEKIFTDHYAANGSYLSTRSRIDFWDNDFAVMQTEAQTSSFTSYTIHPGDELQTHCVYNTMGQPGRVDFGGKAFQEMCLDFLFFFPSQPNPINAVSPFCGLAALEVNGSYETRSRCGGLYNLMVAGQVDRGTEGLHDPLGFGLANLAAERSAQTSAAVCVEPSPPPPLLASRPTPGPCNSSGAAAPDPAVLPPLLQRLLSPLEDGMVQRVNRSSFWWDDGGAPARALNNVALVEHGATASASSTFVWTDDCFLDYNPWRAIDGDDETSWSSQWGGISNATLTIQLPRAHTIQLLGARSRDMVDDPCTPCVSNDSVVRVFRVFADGREVADLSFPSWDRVWYFPINATGREWRVDVVRDRPGTYRNNGFKVLELLGEDARAGGVLRPAPSQLESPPPSPPPSPSPLVYHATCKDYCHGSCCGFSDPAAECSGCDARVGCYPGADCYTLPPPPQQLTMTAQHGHHQQQQPQQLPPPQQLIMTGQHRQHQQQQTQQLPTWLHNYYAPQANVSPGSISGIRETPESQ